MTKSNEPIRILQIVMDISRGSGVANVILNWHRNINRTKIQFDYLVCFPHEKKDSFEEEIHTLGGKIYYVSYKGPFHPIVFLKSIAAFFKGHPYKTIHSHVTALGAFYYPMAKYYGTKNILQHAHLTTWSDKKLSAIRNYLFLHSVWSLIDYKLACSNLAGKAYYGKNYRVINNGIDLERFSFNLQTREQKRAELNLQNKFIVGHVGRFEPQKNHFFLIDIFEEIHRKHPDSALLLVGEGSLLSAVQEYVHQKKLGNSVFFLGLRNDVKELLQAMDVFLLPSLFEGLPVVGVEAQATGLPCLFSDCITDEVLLGCSRRISLKEAPGIWAKEALKFTNPSRKPGAGLSSFDIHQTTKCLENFYKKILSH